MTINDLILLLENQIAALKIAKATAERLGDVARVLEIGNKIAETESTLLALKGL